MADHVFDRTQTEMFQNFKLVNDAGLFVGDFNDWLNVSQETQQKLIDQVKAPPTPTPEALTNERKSVHGNWIDQAACANIIKADMRMQPNWDRLSPSQKEALDMIATKMSRILNGDPNHADHWLDISGYAFLGKQGHVM